MYAKFYDSRNEYMMMDYIVDYRNRTKDISVSNQKMVHRGWIIMRRSTVRWQLCVQWKDVSMSWQPLKYLKESYPVETS